MNLLVIVPLYNDWECLPSFAREMQAALRETGARAELLIVDDGSQTPPPIGLASQLGNAFSAVTRLELARNMGHQRAIVMGLAHVSAEMRPFDAILIMDADGEDRPADLPGLVAEFEARGRGSVVFARRSRRSEGVAFRLFYRLYRAIYRVMTGRSIFVGNYCLLPANQLPRLVRVAELWVHFASGLIRARVPWTAIDTVRGKRYAGESQMDFPTLVLHGLSAIAVYSDVIGIRALLFTGIVSVALVLVIGTVTAIRFFTPLAIPGWASTVVGLSLVILVQMVMSALLFAFVVIGRRSAMGLTPLRDYAQFVLRAGPLA